MTWEYEEKAWANGYGSVCGVDEAGRGPVAGPVCAAAVILPAGIVIEGLNDSKKLSEKKREKLFGALEMLEEIGFPEELIINSSVERLNNYFKGRGLHLFDEEDLL